MVGLDLQVDALAVQKEFLGYPATFRRVEWTGAALFKVDGNKVSDLWVLGDLDALRAQLSAGNE